MTGLPIILSSPSGGGKTSIARQIIKRRDDVGYSVSCTTRPPRAGEVDGVDYHFWTAAQFRDGLENQLFAESAEVHGYLYGTLFSEVRRVVGAGKHVVLDIDVQGAEQLRAVLPDAVLIFVLPPSAEVLVQRLGGRGSEHPETLRIRLRNAASELLQADKYDYVVINQDLDSAVRRVEAIMEAEVVRREHFEDLEGFLDGLRVGLDKILRSQLANTKD